MARTKQADDEQAQAGEQDQDRQNREDAALRERREEIVAEKAVAEREAAGLKDDAAEAAAAKGEDPNAPSTAQVADSSASMARVPDEGEADPEGEARRQAVANPVNPGQPPGAVYPDRTA